MKIFVLYVHNISFIFIIIIYYYIHVHLCFAQGMIYLLTLLIPCCLNKTDLCEKSQDEPAVHNITVLNDAVRARCLLYWLKEKLTKYFEAAKARKASWASIQLSALLNQTRPETMNKPGHMLTVRLAPGRSGSSSSFLSWTA